MISSVISSVARLSLLPARLAGRMAGSLLSGLRGNAAGDGHPAPSSSRTKTSRTRAKAEPKRAASRTRTEAHPKRAGSRTKAQPKRAGSRTKAEPRRAPRRKPLDDLAIARKVESTIFQGVDVDKGMVDVNVAEGVVRLRGEVRTPDLISELETRSARVSDVRRVENLLGLAKVSPPRERHANI
jgi:osmotically-inducible protein OsmY